MKAHWKLVVASLVLIDFTALSIWALSEVGYIGLFQYALASPAGIQILVDLCLALALFSGWMIADARRRGASVGVYLLLTLVLGSVGPLSYLVVRELPSNAVGRKLAQPAVA